MTPLDLTQPLALRGNPTVQVPGPFLYSPGDAFPIAAVLNGRRLIWSPDGQYYTSTYNNDFDLIPLQTTPRKWLRCHYTGNPGTNESFPSLVSMIEAAACDGLVEALRKIISDLNGMLDLSINHAAGLIDLNTVAQIRCIIRAAGPALADWEARK